MSDNPTVKVRVDSNPNLKVRVGQQPAIKIISSLAGVQGSLDQLIDVNADPLNLQNGMVLVYNASNQQWEATLSLTPGEEQNLVVDGGIY